MVGIYAEEAAWCSCEEETQDWDFHDDDNDQVYANGVTCKKHHYTCGTCGLVTQIG